MNNDPMIPCEDAGNLNALSLDLDKYRPHIAHLNLPEEQANEMMRTIWNIMQSFVDRAFGDDAAQLCRKDGEYRLEEAELDGLPVIDYADIDPSQNHNNDDLSGTFRQQANSPRD